MVQTKLRDRNPRVSLLCSWPVPEGVSVLSGSYGRGNVGGKPVDGDFKRIDPGAIARRTARSLTFKAPAIFGYSFTRRNITAQSRTALETSRWQNSQIEDVRARRSLT